ncbi:MAG: DNRLRE domain-containing protein [Bryobacterales bacterium]|nr:DNRLRE domain-containing protein [Bryobacterales bacterium]
MKHIFLLTLVAMAAHAQSIPVAADTFLHSDHTGTNFGFLPTLAVDMKSTSLIRFDLASLPPGTTAASVAKATLTLYVNRVNRPGSLLVHPVSGLWAERTVNFASRPIAGLALPAVPVTTSNVFLTIDITPIVLQWLSGTPNDGLALVSEPNAGGIFTFDSKEDLGTGHPAELQIALKSGAGPAGPQGPVGPRGFNGAPGAPGAPGLSGVQLVLVRGQVSSGFSNLSLSAACPSGKRVISGGCDALFGFVNVQGYTPPAIVKAVPEGNGYTCLFSGGTGINMQVATTVVCANVQ